MWGAVIQGVSVHGTFTPNPPSGEKMLIKQEDWNKRALGGIRSPAGSSWGESRERARVEGKTGGKKACPRPKSEDGPLSGKNPGKKK